MMGILSVTTVTITPKLYDPLFLLIENAEKVHSF